MRAAVTFVFLLCGISIAHAGDAPPHCDAIGIVAPVRTSVLNTRDYYPSLSLQLGEEGTTVVIYTVRADGKTQDAHVLTSSGNVALDNASLDVVKDMTFQPALQNGNPIACNKGIALQWLLPDGVKAAGILADMQKNSVVLQAPLTEYPQASLDGHETGITVVTLRLGTDGTIGDAIVRDSSGSPRLDAAALHYARSGTLDAALLKGKMKDGSVDVGIIWAPYPVVIPGADTASH